MTRVHCNTCGTLRLSQDIGVTGACLLCGQMPDAKPGDVCNGCGGEGVVDGLVVGNGEGRMATCWACKGFKVVPLPPEPPAQHVPSRHTATAAYVDWAWRHGR